MKEDNDPKELHRPPCIRTSQSSYSPRPASSPASLRSVHGLDVILHLGVVAMAPPSVVPNMVSKIRGIGRQLFVERLTVPGPPGPWPRFCCLTCAAHDMFQRFFGSSGLWASQPSLSITSAAQVMFVFSRRRTTQFFLFLFRCKLSFLSVHLPRTNSTLPCLA